MNRGFAQILKPGIHTSIQDVGRVGYMDIGVPISGCMDSLSAKQANFLVGNKESAACIEITIMGPTIRFSAATLIAICGASFSLKINNQVFEGNLIKIEEGDVVQFGGCKNGCRAYIAIKGGWQSPVVLGSRSQYVAITGKSRMAKNHVLQYISSKDKNISSINIKNSLYREPKLKIHPGPEFDMLNSNQVSDLQNKKWIIADYSNRMAYGFNATLDQIKYSGNMPSSVVCPGIIQLTPSGNLYVLMRDCQTTGGYPRIGFLEEPEINMLAQMKSGEEVMFSFEIN